MKSMEHILILVFVIFISEISAAKFVKSPTEITAIEGGMVMLRCRFTDGNSRLRRTWTNGTSVIYADATKYSFDPRITLDVNNAQEYSVQLNRITAYDEGKYTCTLYHGREMEMSINLKVNVPARFTSQVSQDLILDEGGKGALTCMATGKPEPKITWRHLVPSADGNRGTGPHLPLSGITREGAGIYECTADNKIAAPVTHRIRVIVRYPPELNMYKTDNDVSQALGQETVLQCTTSAVPVPSITWHHSGYVYEGKRPTNRIRVLNIKQGNTVTSKLIIKQVALDDFGNFVCVATNRMGTINTTVVLKRVIPEETRPPPHVVFAGFQNRANGQKSDKEDGDGNSGKSSNKIQTFTKLFTIFSPLLGLKIVTMFHI
uniref:limbic system-associated membrane protein-like n=1 Tax=Styela clava TaxID=7725 RepID=UPI0019393D59|nr:limbic system-associated membrane protein-like [Styela clava]